MVDNYLRVKVFSIDDSQLYLTDNHYLQLKLIAAENILKATSLEVNSGLMIHMGTRIWGASNRFFRIFTFKSTCPILLPSASRAIPCPSWCVSHAFCCVFP